MREKKGKTKHHKKPGIEITQYATTLNMAQVQAPNRIYMYMTLGACIHVIAGASNSSSSNSAWGAKPPLSGKSKYQGNVFANPLESIGWSPLVG